MPGANAVTHIGLTNRFLTAARKRFALEWWGFLIIFLVLLPIGLRVYVHGKQANGGLLGRPLRVGIVPWPGYTGGLVANHGLRPNKDSVFWKDHNLFVEFVVIDSDDQLRRAFALGGANNGVDVMWSTVDSLAQQFPELSKQGIRPRAFMQVDWSHGGDAIVAKKGIDRIEDLKGLQEKKIAVSMAASQWLLEYSLDNSSLTDDDRTRIRQNLRRLTKGSPEARDLFINKEVDVAVLWEPDVASALKERTGSHLLIDTSAAPNLIADVMVAREDFIQQHPKVVKAFINGWREGTTKAINDPMLAVKVLMDEPELGFDGFGEAKTRELLGKTILSTLDDNVDMFGLADGDAFFDHLFNRASRIWLKGGYITDSAAAVNARDPSFLKEIYEVQRESFVRMACDANIPTVELQIAFPPDSTDLSPEAKQRFGDRDIPLLLRTNGEVRFCVEADTNDGDNRQRAAATKRGREDAVIKYLIEHCNRPPNQFVSAGASDSATVSDGKNKQYMRLKIAAIKPPAAN